MFREEIKVLDCTIRDGGLINDHQFELAFVRDVYKAVSEAGVDYMEIGYKNSRDMFCPKQYGPWKFCDDEDIFKVIDGIESQTKISVMVDVDRVNMDGVNPRSESPVDLIRTACYAKDIDKAISMENHFHSLGYETAINIMAISRDQGPELDEALHQVEEESHVTTINIVDSFGSLYQEEIEVLVKRFASICKTRQLGFHGHNNQQLAFSNTIESIIHGANRPDATVYGIGRGAGNCTLELLLGFLKNPKYDIRPILDLIQHRMLSLRETMEWGYIIPYAIAGMKNEHPRTAIALRESDQKDEYRKYYESFVAEETD